jgi:Xaa-Pro aminopeptidase
MTTPSSPRWADRLQHVRQHCEQHDLGALVVSTPSNITYLTGFAGSAGLLLVAPDNACLLVDGRYEGSVRERAARGNLGPVSPVRVERRYDLTLEAVVRAQALARIGFEAAHVTVASLRRWQQMMPSIDWRPTDGVVEHLRVIKDAYEIDVLRRAAGKLSDVARSAGDWIAAGRVERDVASDIDRALIRAGFSAPAFPTIVASGEQTAYPHARPTDRVMRKEDLVLLDFGGVLDGYCVDLTRMAAIGQVSSRAEALYAAVRAAQDAARSTVRAGIAASDVDDAARRTLGTHGLADAFLHGTGHGLGLEVHEAPRLGRPESGSREMLEAGMVCTLEPGAYVEGLGGVRLEDDVLVTPEGCEVLTTAPRELLVV